MATPKQKPGRSKQNYSTPTEFLREVHAKLGIDEFTIDLAASAENTVATKFYDEATNSLDQDWEGIGKWGWCNPPYGHILPWVRKAYLSRSYIAMLLPASVGANWWKEFVHYKAEVYFLNGRLAFMRDKPNWLYPKDCALVLYSPEDEFCYEIWSWKDEYKASLP